MTLQQANTRRRDADKVLRILAVVFLSLMLSGSSAKAAFNYRSVISSAGGGILTLEPISALKSSVLTDDTYIELFADTGGNADSEERLLAVIRADEDGFAVSPGDYRGYLYVPGQNWQTTIEINSNSTFTLSIISGKIRLEVGGAEAPPAGKATITVFSEYNNWRTASHSGSKQ